MLIGSESKIKQWVAWCVLEGEAGNDARWNLTHEAYIHNAQIKHKIPKEYRIHEKTDWANVSDILTGFKQNLIQDYFLNRIVNPQGKYVIDGNVFFIYALLNYLGQRLDKFSYKGYFTDKNLLKKEISRERYSDGSGYSITYEITQAAEVAYKLYYICLIYCRKAINDKLLKDKNFDFLHYNGEEARIAEIINTKTITQIF